ncbi:hypothetical protein GOODEAATRI_019354 [Goodea atripinnis]|uniref:Uncharacterized protein n=1 Tax=Goodea atripinnis TaxID=208336 RepID=A0ABV0PQC4_9TELE
MSLDCGRKPEYLVRTNTCTGRTCKLHAERPLARNRTQDLLAARQQYYQLCHLNTIAKLISNFLLHFYCCSHSEIHQCSWQQKTKEKTPHSMMLPLPLDQ